MILTDIGWYFHCAHIIAKAFMFCFAFTKAYIYMGGIAFDSFPFLFSFILNSAQYVFGMYLPFYFLWRNVSHMDCRGKPLFNAGVMTRKHPYCNMAIVFWRTTEEDIPLRAATRRRGKCFDVFSEVYVGRLFDCVLRLLGCMHGLFYFHVFGYLV
jgi:hypothetical protein